MTISQYMKIVKSVYPEAYLKKIPYWQEWAITDPTNNAKGYVISYGRRKIDAWRTAAEEISELMIRKLES